MPYRLPVAATIAEAFRFLTGRFTDWFPAALVPLTVWIALEFAIDRGWLAGLTFGLGSDAPMIAYMLLNAPSILAYLVIAVLLLLYAVALHRRALGMDRDASVRAGLVWRARHWRYVGQGVVVVAIVALGFIVSATFVPALGAVAGTAGVLESAAGQVTLTVIVLMLFAVPVALLACMVLPALPAAAVEDHAVTLSEASSQAKGNLWRTTFVLGLGGLLPFWLVERGITFLVARSAADTAFVAETTGIVVNFLGFTVLITLLSLVYRRLRDNVPLRRDQPPR